MPHDGDTFYDVYLPQFSQAEVCEVVGETIKTVENWIGFGFLKVDAYVLGPRRTPLKRFSIVSMARAALIASCVNHAGVKPSLASEIADFCSPLIGEHFERNAAGKRRSDCVRLVVSQQQRDGRLVSWAAYRRPDEHHFYVDDPVLNPNAQRMTFPADAPSIVVPLTDMWSRVFLAATDLLAKQQRGGLDVRGRPVEI
jgi:hypothetical protein